MTCYIKVEPALDVLLRRHYGIHATVRGSLGDAVHVSLYSDVTYNAIDNKGIREDQFLIQTGTGEYQPIDRIMRELGLEIDLRGFQIEPLDLSSRGVFNDLTPILIEPVKIRARLDVRLKNTTDVTAAFYRQIQLLAPDILKVRGIDVTNVSITDSHLVMHSRYMQQLRLADEIAGHINSFFEAFIVSGGKSFADCAAFNLESSICWKL